MSVSSILLFSCNKIILIAQARKQFPHNDANLLIVVTPILGM